MPNTTHQRPRRLARARRSTARSASATAAAACRSACRGGQPLVGVEARHHRRRGGGGRGARRVRGLARPSSERQRELLPEVARRDLVEQLLRRRVSAGARAARASSARCRQRRDSLMNDSSIGAIRASASSQVTRGGRGRWKASATRSNQPPIFISASSLTLYARLWRPWNSAATVARARSSAWMWLVNTSSSGTSTGVPCLMPVERQPRLRVDAGRAQDRQHDALPPRPGAQPVLGGDATLRARRLRAARTALVDARAGAVAVDARWSKRRRSAVVCFAPSPARRRACRVRGSSRPSAGGGAKCSTANGAARRRVRVDEPVEVADDRDDAGGAQLAARRRGGGSGRTGGRDRRSRRAVRSATSPQPISKTRITPESTPLPLPRRRALRRAPSGHPTAEHAAPDYHKAQRPLVHLRRRRHRPRRPRSRPISCSLRLPQRRLRHLQGQGPRRRGRLRRAPGDDAHRRGKGEGLRAVLRARSPKTDLVIEVREVRRAGDIQVRRLPCRIESIDKPPPTSRSSSSSCPPTSACSTWPASTSTCC